MKTRISATVNKKTLQIIKSLLKERNYRNKSHVVETAIELLEKEENKNDKNKK